MSDSHLTYSRDWERFAVQEARMKSKVCRHDAMSISYQDTAVAEGTWVHTDRLCGGIIPKKIVAKLDHAAYLDP